LHTCLFASSGTDLLPALREGDDATVNRLLTGVWAARRDRYSEERARSTRPLRRVEMSYIGG
jgi:cyclic pyranopterin phosphate synthase